MACLRWACLVLALVAAAIVAFLELSPLPAAPKSYGVPKTAAEWHSWSDRWAKHEQCRGAGLLPRVRPASTPLCGEADPDCSRQRRAIEDGLAALPDDSVSGTETGAWDYGMQPGFLRSVGADWVRALTPGAGGDGNASTSPMERALAAAGEPVFFCAAGLRTFAWRRNGVRVSLASLAALLGRATRGRDGMRLEDGAEAALSGAAARLDRLPGAPSSGPPLLVFLHGWPSGPAEYAPVMEALARIETDDASLPGVTVDVLVPALPGFGWSPPAVAAGPGTLPADASEPGAPAEPWTLPRRGPDGVDMARWLAAVPRALGYVPWDAAALAREGAAGYLPSGGDYGGLIAGVLAQTEVPGAMLGAHLAMWPVQARRPSTLARTAVTAAAPPSVAGVAAAAGVAFDEADRDRLGGGSLASVVGGLLLHSGYLHQQTTFPDTLAAVLHGRPVATAAWVLDKFVAWQGRCYAARPGAEFRDPEACFRARYPLLPALSMVQDHVRSVRAPLRLYRDAIRSPRSIRSLASRVDAPVALMSLEQETLFRVPFAWAGDKFTDVRQMSSLPGVGHFAGLEEPEAVLADALRFLVARVADTASDARAGGTFGDEL